jgi:hypothetical protein
MAITCPICPESHCTGSMMKTDTIAILIALQNDDTWINEALEKKQYCSAAVLHISQAFD